MVAVSGDVRHSISICCWNWQRRHLKSN